MENWKEERDRKDERVPTALEAEWGSKCQQEEGKDL